MAAGITEKDSMFYVREAPWHGLGYHRGGIRAAVGRMEEKQKTLQMLDQRARQERESLAQVQEGL